SWLGLSSLKSSPSGEPSGKSGNGVPPPETCRDVPIFTTAGESSAASSATDSGPRADAPDGASRGAASAAATSAACNDLSASPISVLHYSPGPPARSQASRLPSDEPEKYKSGRRASQGRATDCCCRHRLNGGQRLLHLLREGGVNETLDYDRQRQSR